MPSRVLACCVFAFAVGTASAQFFVPDADPTTGTCNVFPFGSTGGANVKYQQLVTPAELGNAPCTITGLGFAKCGAGTLHFNAIQVVLAHKPGASTLVANFAQNLVSNPTIVVLGTNHDWDLPADSWQDVGMQVPFAYNGIDNLVVEVTVTGSQWTASGTGSPGTRAGSHQRVFASNWTTSPPANGTLSSQFALKVEIDTGTAKVSSYGRGCAGSNTLVPAMAVTGSPQLGQSIVFELTNALANSIALHTIGFSNGAPYPADLGFLGAPNCFLYTDLSILAATLVDATGHGTLPFLVPNDASLVGLPVYAQFFDLDPTANAFGWTTTNYVRVQFGP